MINVFYRILLDLLGSTGFVMFCLGMFKVKLVCVDLQIHVMPQIAAVV